MCSTPSRKAGRADQWPRQLGLNELEWERSPRRPLPPAIEGGSTAVAIDTEEPTAPPEPVAEEPGGSTARMATTIGLRTVAVVVGVIVAFVALGQAFDFMREKDANRFLVIAVALAVGVGGIFVLFWA